MARPYNSAEPAWGERGCSMMIQRSFRALSEKDRGNRGCPSGRRQSLSDPRTKLGTPGQGSTSCSRNILMVRPASINAPNIVDSECIHSRVDWFVMIAEPPVYVVSLLNSRGRSAGVWKSYVGSSL